jgi:hypothetical protein
LYLEDSANPATLHNKINQFFNETPWTKSYF